MCGLVKCIDHVVLVNRSGTRHRDNGSIFLNYSNRKEFKIFNDPEFLAYLAWYSICVTKI